MKENKLALKDRILQLLTGTLPPPPLSEEDKNKEPRGITIRFSPEVRNFLDHHSVELGCSVQNIVSMSMQSIMKASLHPEHHELALITSKFRSLFNHHGIPTIDIPEYIKCRALNRNILLDDEHLINEMNTEILDEVAGLFGVNSDWIKGTSEQAFELSSQVYKNLDGVAFKLVNSRLRGERPCVLFVIGSESNNVTPQLKAACSKTDNANKLSVAVILKKDIKVRNNYLTIYEPLDLSMSWDDSRSRDHMKYLMMFCRVTNIKYEGITIPRKHMRSLCFQSLPIAELLNCNSNSWYPSDFICNSKDTNPEYDNYMYLSDIYNNKPESDSTASMSNIRLHENTILQPKGISEQE